MNRVISGVCMACGILALGTAQADAPAAKLKQLDGVVLVNLGGTYQTASEGMSLHVGDRLMVMEGGSMVLAYSDGCVARFRQNQIITIQSASTCDGGTAQSQAITPKFADAMGGGGGGGGGGVTANGYALGAAVLGGGGLLFANSNSSGGSNISPQ